MARKSYTSSEEAKTAILDAAEKIVVTVGPAGLRISAVAKEAGMAHPNIIHHFGSREGLLKALAQRVSDNATLRITQAISKALESETTDLLHTTTHVLDKAYEGDQGKLAVWLAMSGELEPAKENMHEIVTMAHKLRQRVNDKVTLKNTEHIVLLVTLALIGEVVSGSNIKEALGFESSENSQEFRLWLAGLLLKLSDKELDEIIE